MRTTHGNEVANSGRQMTNQAERELRKFLETIPYPWSIVPHSKHKMVVIAERSVGVLSQNRSKGNDAKQIISAVKRRIRELEAT